MSKKLPPAAWISIFGIAFCGGMGIMSLYTGHATVAIIQFVLAGMNVYPLYNTLKVNRYF